MKRKLDIITRAFSKLRISRFTSDPSPEDITLALKRLEQMMAEFEARNICLEYNFESDPDQDSHHTIPSQHIYAVITNLAVRLMPDFGKGAEEDQVLMKQARQSYAYMLSITAKVRQTQYPARTPRGEGQRIRGGYRGYAHYVPRSRPEQNCNTKTVFHGDLVDFKEERFAKVLSKTDTIIEVETNANTGLNITNVNLSENFITYRVNPIVNNRFDDEFLRVVFVATISDGRKITYQTEFIVKQRPETQIDQAFTLNDVFITGVTTLPVANMASYTITFIAPPEGFNISQVVVTNGTVANLREITPTTFLVDFTAPSAVENVRLTVSRPNFTASINIEVTAISFMITGPTEVSPAHQDTYTITFSEEASFLSINFITSAISVTNGTINGAIRAVSSIIYEVDITSGGMGDMVINIESGIIVGPAKTVQVIAVPYLILGPIDVGIFQTITYTVTFDREADFLNVNFIQSSLFVGTIAEVITIRQNSSTVFEIDIRNNQVGGYNIILIDPRIIQIEEFELIVTAKNLLFYDEFDGTGDIENHTPNNYLTVGTPSEYQKFNIGFLNAWVRTSRPATLNDGQLTIHQRGFSIDGSLIYFSQELEMRPNSWQINFTLPPGSSDDNNLQLALFSINQTNFNRDTVISVRADGTFEMRVGTFTTTRNFAADTTQPIEMVITTSNETIYNVSLNGENIIVDFTPQNVRSAGVPIVEFRQFRPNFDTPGVTIDRIIIQRL